MQIRLADYIADFLVKNGITHLFSVTGGGAMHLNDAFGHKEGLTVVYNHHEQACAYAAEGYVRAYGKLPAVCVTTGPGGTNAVTGVMCSWLDSLPMFIVSGQVKYSCTIAACGVPVRQIGDQEFNIVDCVRCMTKYAVMISDPETIRYHLERALYLATHGRPGPVWIDVPVNFQAAKIDPETLRGYDPSEDAHILPPPADEGQLKELLGRIAAAKRPVLLAGEAIRIAGAKELFERLAKKLQIPVVSAWNAHDLIEDGDPLYCGRPGTQGDRGGNIVVQSSDLVVSLGCRMNLRQISYNYENFAKNAVLAYIDIDRAELDKPTLHADVKIHADIRDALAKLDGMPYDGHGQHRKWLEHARAVHAKYPVVLPSYYETDSPVNPYVFMKELSLLLPEGQLTVSSNGTACVCSFQAMVIKKGQRLFTNSGAAPMGYGLPAAIGACIAGGNRSTVCLEGDGSIQMNLQELQTAVHNKLDLKIFWLNNDGYHSIRQTQTNIFHGNFCGIDEGCGISFPSAEKIAAAYGIPYFRADSVKALAFVLKEVLAARGPVICEAVLDKRQFFAPKLSSKTYPDGTIVSPPLEDMYPFLPPEELAEDMKGE